MVKRSIQARIQCTIEVPVGTWGGGPTDLEVLANQVRAEGRLKVARLIKEEGGTVIGQPRVLFLLLSEDE